MAEAGPSMDFTDDQIRAIEEQWSGEHPQAMWVEAFSVGNSSPSRWQIFQAGARDTDWGLSQRMPSHGII